MKTVLKYKVIKDKSQYNSYCDKLLELLGSNTAPVIQDEIDLLTLLIESYDKEQNVPSDHDPIRLLRSFMEDHQLAPYQLAAMLNISDEHVAAILNYNKRLSKMQARMLAEYFKVLPAAFNTSYTLNKKQLK
jgi:HTH-type transcriptional regulator/antitoxin HigA